MASNRSSALPRQDLSALASSQNVWTEQFISRVSHEARTPLNAILGFSRLLSSGNSGPLTGQQTDFIHYIEEAGEKLLIMACDLADLARYQHGSLELEVQDVDLTTLITRLEARFQKLAGAQNLVFTVTNPSKMRVRADQDRLKRVLIHLLTNAFQFNRTRGFVAVQVSRFKDNIFISIADGGRGFPDADVGAIFEFNRMTGDQPRQGSRLGLPMSNILINSMGGELSLATTEGEGSTFTIRLNH